jgi:hypothetical protein
LSIFKTLFKNGERKEEEERDRIRSKIIPIAEKANRNRKDNLTDEERRGMEDLRKRKEIIIQPADKGGAITLMKKEWYKEKVKDQILEEHVIIGNNNKKYVGRNSKQNDKKQFRRLWEKKSLWNKRTKYIKKEGNLP